MAEYSVFPEIIAKPATLEVLEQAIQVLAVGNAFNLASGMGSPHLVQCIR